LHLLSLLLGKVRADSRRLLQFRGSTRDRKAERCAAVNPHHEPRSSGRESAPSSFSSFGQSQSRLTSAATVQGSTRDRKAERCAAVNPHHEPRSSGRASAPSSFSSFGQSQSRLTSAATVQGFNS